MTFDPQILDIVVCPITKGKLRYDSENERLVSVESELAFPIRDGVPILSVSEAEPLSPDDLKVFQ